MKRIVAIVVVAMLAFGLMGCSAQTSSAPVDHRGDIDLSGWWIQDEFEGNDWMSAHVTDGSIAVYWVETGGAKRELFWYGSYEKPDGVPTSFEWTSVREHPGDNVDTSRLSALGEKTFSYADGMISFDLTTNGNAEPIVLIHEDA